MIGDFWTAFVLGLLTPLTAVCVLPLYPGFLSYMSQQLNGQNDRKKIRLLGVLVTLGVISFMLIIGIVFTAILQISLTKVIGILSPIAFGLLFGISIVLLFDFDIGRLLPQFQIPIVKNPYVSAFAYGFFFGAIVLPCNPAFIAAFFTRVALSASFGVSLLQFFMFGAGIGGPLLLFSLLSTAWSSAIIRFLSQYKSWINRVSGAIMLVISIYYLLFVFRIFS